jgi:cytochrome P450
VELLKYGEMATVQLGSKTWVVLNSTRVTNELINKRGAITNERPPYPVASGLISHDLRSVLLPTAQWSEKRRVMHQLLSGTAMKKYAEYQDLESKQMLGEYVCRPSEWYNHHARYSNSVINRIAFGRRVLRMTPKLVDIYKVIISFIINNPPGNIIDCFPELAKLPKPLQWWRKKWENVGALTTKVYQAYWIPIRKEIEEGRAEPCFARDVLIGEDAKYSGNDEASMYLAGQLVEAGSDTTRASLNIFVMAAICFPEMYLKARGEIDALCGKNAERLPTFDDEPNLPYVHALIKELLRWRPIFTWSPEHVLTEDLEFEGYRFPKGAAFMINHQGLCQNPDEFVDPDVVKPERWLNGRETDILHGVTSFGGGRRVCVGYKLAQKSLFINISRLIYCFDYKKVC